MEPVNLTSPRNIKRKYRPKGRPDLHKPQRSSAAVASTLDGPVMVIGPTGKARMVQYVNDKPVE